MLSRRLCWSSHVVKQSSCRGGMLGETCSTVILYTVVVYRTLLGHVISSMSSRKGSRGSVRDDVSGRSPQGDVQCRNRQVGEGADVMW